jgi:hypothetical protein
VKSLTRLAARRTRCQWRGDLEVLPDKVTILAEAAEHPQEIDTARAKSQRAGRTAPEEQQSQGRLHAGRRCFAARGNSSQRRARGCQRKVDSAQWKNGSVPTVVALAPRLYLTPWVYPISLLDKDSSGGPDARETRNWGGGPGNIPPGAPPASQRFPGSGRNGDNDTIQGQKNPGPDSSNHRVLMKNVESSRTSDGGVTLTSQRSNIKLDKSTTYVLATSDLQPAK